MKMILKRYIKDLLSIFGYTISREFDSVINNDKQFMNIYIRSYHCEVY